MAFRRHKRESRRMLLRVTKQGNVYVVETFRHRVRKISPDGLITTVAGNGSPGFSGDGGIATAASLNRPAGIAVDSAGNIFISDSFNNRIREILVAPPALSLSTTQVTMNASSHGAAAQTTVAVNSLVQGLDYSIDFSTQGGGDWLGLAALVGKAPGVLSIFADPTNLGPGTYQGTVTISCPNAVPQTLKISVSFQVAQSQPPKLAVGSQSLSFSLSASSALATTQLTVSNQGGGNLSLLVAANTLSGGPWLQVAPQQAIATAATPATLTVTATRGNLAPGQPRRVDHRKHERWDSTLHRSRESGG